MRSPSSFFFYCYGDPADLPSFPTRRSSDLGGFTQLGQAGQVPPHDTHHGAHRVRSEEHTSELQSRGHLVCRLLLEKKTDEVGIMIVKKPQSNYKVCVELPLRGDDNYVRHNG